MIDPTSSALPNDLPAIRADQDYAHLPLRAWDDLIARLTLAEARLAAHHKMRWDWTCAKCRDTEAL